MPTGKATCFVDTNILIYAVDPKETEKRAIAASLIRNAALSESLVLSPQSLNECYRVLTERLKSASRSDARDYCRVFVRHCTAPLTFATTAEAWRIQDACGFSWWDCTLLASASLAGCGLFYSEDLQHGRRIGDLEIRNPFASA
ncbi:PIN domain-containing protein [Methylopila musalis]|uniref:Ribonuclease VapC n=1 Tax=Methylopila musalis TaxID=1134781 RepID=A0ABW3Z4Y0_9HYPH